MADWADEKASELLRYLRLAPNDREARELVAAALRIERSTGKCEGIAELGKAFDKTIGKAMQ